MPPKIEKIVVKIPKKNHLYLFVKVIGIKNISGGMGMIIDSKNENIVISFHGAIPGYGTERIFFRGVD